MIVANAIIKGNRDKLLSFKKISNPVTLQIGGSNPQDLAEACKIAEGYGYKEVNLNLGLTPSSLPIGSPKTKKPSPMIAKSKLPFVC